MSEFIEVLSPSALKDLQALNSEITKTIAGVKEVNSNMISIKTPSGSDSAIKKLTADYDAQRVTIQKLQAQLNSLSVTQTKATTSAINQRNATREQAVAQQILRVETDRNIRANTLLGGAYARASAQLLILKKTAKDYAIALGESHPKTLQAIKDADNLSGRILSADKSVGDFQRNVGNYSNGVVGGFQKMFSSVRQLAYILPGIGIAGIFGLALDPLFNFISGLELFKSKIDAVKESTKSLNEINKEAVTSANQELITLKGNLRIAQDVTLSYKERMIAVENLQKTYPFYFENLTKEQILAGKTTEAEKALTEAILSRAKANAAVGKITENQGKIIDLEEQRLELVSILSKAEAQASSDRQRALKGDEAAAISNLQSADRIASAKRKIANVDKEIAALTVVNNRLTEYSLANQEKAIGLDYKEEKSKKDVSKAKREDVEAIKLQTDAQEGLLQKLIIIRDGFKKLQTQTSSSNAEFKKFTDLIKYYDDLIKSIEKDSLAESAKQATDEFERLYKNIYITTDATNGLTKGMQDFLRQFTEGFFSNAGLPTLFKALNDEIEGFGTNWQVTFTAMAEITQEAFNFMSEASNAHFANEYANLEQQRNIAIMFAGESASAREEIERQYQVRQKQIKEREFKAKKQQAIFNIILDTAQAVVASLPNIPLSIAVGVIGALQLATVSAQQTPQYEHGTDNHIGGDMIINDQKGSNYKELVETPDGKKRIYEGRNVRVNAPKGTKVKTASETMDYLIFNNDLNSILTGNGISNPKIELNAPSIDLKPLINAIENKESANITIDKSGLNFYVKNGHTIKTNTNNRINFIGKSV